MPAAIASTAKPMVTPGESLMLSNGKSPVRINHRPSRIIPRFLPAKPFVTAISSPSEMRTNASIDDALEKRSTK
jgi:hypothetical protein